MARRRAVGSRVAELPAGDRDVVQHALAWLQTRDLSQNVSDPRATLDWLASEPFVDPRRISSLGFCMGGGLSARLAASGADLAGAVIFYGEHPPVDQIPNIRCRVLGLYGGEDHRITDGVPELARAMAAAYHWFMRGLLVWILVTQVFVFYSSQLAGLGGFILDLVAYWSLRFALTREIVAGRHQLGAASRPG